MMVLFSNTAARRAKLACRFAAVALAWLVACMSGSLFAAEVANLYRAELPVQSQQQSERTAALRTGLAQVIVRVSGQRESAQGVAVREALQRAEQYLSQYSYTTANIPDAEGNPVPTQMLRLEFDPSLVNQLLRQHGLPIWGSNRPRVLLWLTLEDETGRRVLGSPDENAELLRAMREAARARGIPLLLPLLDLEDQATISVTESWALFRLPLENVMQRYRVPALLAGRAYRETDGSFSARWLILFNDRSHSLESQAQSLAELPLSVLHELADSMAQRYAVDTASGPNQSIRISVSGVRDVADYVAITQYIGGLVAVRDFQVVQVSGRELLIELQTEGAFEQIRQVLQLDDKLVPLPAMQSAVQSADPAAPLASYEWRP